MPLSITADTGTQGEVLSAERQILAALSEQERQLQRNLDLSNKLGKDVGLGGGNASGTGGRGLVNSGPAQARRISDSDVRDSFARTLQETVKAKPGLFATLFHDVHGVRGAAHLMTGNFSPHSIRGATELAAGLTGNSALSAAATTLGNVAMPVFLGKMAIDAAVAKYQERTDKIEYDARNLLKNITQAQRIGLDPLESRQIQKDIAEAHTIVEARAKGRYYDSSGKLIDRKDKSPRLAEMIKAMERDLKLGKKLDDTEMQAFYETNISQLEQKRTLARQLGVTAAQITRNGTRTLTTAQFNREFDEALGRVSPEKLKQIAAQEDEKTRVTKAAQLQVDLRRKHDPLFNIQQRETETLAQKTQEEFMRRAMDWNKE